MVDERHIVFKVEGTSPLDLAYDRLLAFHAQLKRLLGSPGRVRWVDIVQSSHASVFITDADYEDECLERVATASTGLADSEEANDAYRQVEHLLADYELPSAVVRFPNGEPFSFTPKERPSEPEEIAGVPVNASMFIKPFGASRKNLSYQQYDVKCEDLQTGETFLAQADHDIGVNLAKHLEEEMYVQGNANWTRSAEGSWTLSKFRIMSFHPYSPTPIAEVLEKLGATEYSWPEDIHARLEAERDNK